MHAAGSILTGNRLTGLFLVVIIFFSSCEKKRYYSGSGAELKFSEDTIHFDTVFTSIGSTTRELRIINPYNTWLLVDRISLAGADNTSFRLNLDGIPGNDFRDVEIPPSDSLFLFIDAVIDPRNESNPVFINDSVEFEINGHLQDVDLIAWGQDIHLINSETITTSTWTEGKPYVIYNHAFVDTAHVLTISRGTRVLFHRNSTMYVAGRLEVNGSVDKPVVFASDRIEEAYLDIPGQWQGLYFLNGSTGNIMNNVSVRNASSAVHCGNLGAGDPPPDLSINNAYIAHNSVSGLSSIGASINATNTVIAHCGFFSAFLSKGGSYTFLHCTLANQWDYSNRTTPALYISDYYDYNDERYLGGNTQADFYNTVITGRRESEIIVDSHDDSTLDVKFFNCILQYNGEVDLDSEDCLYNSDPLFINWNEYDFRPDTLSPLINRGSDEYALLAPDDIRGINRFTDAGPDIGAFERQAGENSDKR